ncbi:MAG: anthranilate phosphoribosyltransferase [Alphaproteobacteria bacterium]|nr:anthranilate phosphoribosyltransferase [Alphaproteobacteria bacterium]
MKNSIQDIFNQLFKKNNLNEKQSDLLVKKIFNGELNNIQTTIILTLLYQKGESFEEIYSFVKFLKSKSLKLKLKGSFIDTCGTGGDNKNSFNFSTATSILLSTFDIKIIKHGNRSVTSKSGSFDVLESLGIKIFADPKKIENFFFKNNICFLFAPYFHATLKNIADIRKSIPFRTIFNLLGPLLNPVKLKYQLLGVSDEKNLMTHAKCMKQLGIKKGWVVYNENGFDELTTTSNNIFVEIKDGKLKPKRKINPISLGFKLRTETELKGGSPKENAFLMRRLFDGETGAIRDNVVLNTAAALVVCEKVNSLKEGIKLAQKNIDSGLAQKKLNKLSST